MRARRGGAVLPREPAEIAGAYMGHAQFKSILQLPFGRTQVPFRPRGAPGEMPPQPDGPVQA
jgi:hypothetical protein